MVIIITSLNPQRIRSASRWWGGAVSAHSTREEITPQKHVGELTQIFLLCMILPIYPMLAFLPPRSCSLMPSRTPSPAVKAPNTPNELGFPSWLRALTLCRVSPKQASAGTQNIARAPAQARKRRSGFVSPNRFTINRLRCNLE